MTSYKLWYVDGAVIGTRSQKEHTHTQGDFLYFFMVLFFILFFYFYSVQVEKSNTWSSTVDGVYSTSSQRVDTDMRFLPSSRLLSVCVWLCVQQRYIILFLCVDWDKSRRALGGMRSQEKDSNFFFIFFLDKDKKKEEEFSNAAVVVQVRTCICTYSTVQYSRRCIKHNTIRERERWA